MGCESSKPGPIKVRGSASQLAPEELCVYDPAKAPFWSDRPDGERALIAAAKGPASLESVPFETIIAVFKRAVARHGDSLALATERPCPPLDSAGVAPPQQEWKTWTYLQYYAEVSELAKGLLALGVDRMEGVTVFGFNSPEWVMTQTAVIMVNGLVAGIYPTDNADAVSFKTRHCGAKVAFVDDVAKLDKYKAKIDEMTRLQTIVVWSSEYAGGHAALTRADGSSVKIVSWSEVKAMGKAITDQALEDKISQLKPNQAATLIYTSGTTGNPKAVMITHDNLIWESRMVFTQVPTIGQAGQERVLSYLPLSHIAGLMMDWMSSINITANRPGYCTTYFARVYDLKAGSFGDRLRAVRPTIFFGVPRVFEKIAEKMQAVGAKSKGLKKMVATWAKKKGLEYHMNCQVGGNGMIPGGYDRAQHMVLSKIKAALGLQEAKYIFSGAAPIQRVTQEYFGSLGININEAYGMSENTGAATIGTDECHLWGSVGGAYIGTGVKVLRNDAPDGQPPKWVEAKVAKDLFNPTEEEQGELCFRGRHVMLGYMSSPYLNDQADIKKKNEATIDTNGFLHSGDKGAVDARGMFRVTGRYKELIIGSGGENIAPVPIEDKMLAMAPALSKAIMIGDKRKFNVMLITLKTEGATGETPGTGQLTGPALDVSPKSKTTAEAMNDPVWIEYITNALAKVNADGSVVVSQAFRVEKFTILPLDVSVESGELTPTLKLKRNVVDTIYQKQIDAMYAESAKDKYVKFA